MATEFPRKVDLTKIENPIKVDIGVFRPLDRRDLIQASKLPLRFVQLLRCRKIGLVKYDQVGESDLLARLGQLFEVWLRYIWRQRLSLRRQA